MSSSENTNLKKTVGIYLIKYTNMSIANNYRPIQEVFQ